MKSYGIISGLMYIIFVVHTLVSYYSKYSGCSTLLKTRCTRGDARSFFLYLQNVFVCTKPNFL